MYMRLRVLREAFCNKSESLNQLITTFYHYQLLSVSDVDQVKRIQAAWKFFD